MRILVIIGFFIPLILLSGCLTNQIENVLETDHTIPDTVVETENNDKCKSDLDCKEEFKCYYSQLCSPNPYFGCEEQKGDLLCHKSCKADSDCPNNMPNCEIKEFFYGDVRTTDSICVK